MLRFLRHILIRHVVDEGELIVDPKSKYLVDLDEEPFTPTGFMIAHHEKGGTFEWDPEKAANYYPHKTRVDSAIFNANLFSFLIRRKSLIPINWEEKVPFWRTIFNDRDGALYIAVLTRTGDEWVGHLQRLYYDLFEHKLELAAT